MADIYVRSTDGSDADSGATWALAKATLTDAAAIDAAGDRIFISQNHAESTASAITFALAGTAASPTQIICANDGAEPPTAVASSGTITTTGNSAISFTGVSFYVEGLTFSAGTGAVSPTLDAGSGSTGSRALFKNCNFTIPATGASARVRGIFGTGAISSWENCGVRFGAAGQGISLGNSGAFRWSGGSVLSGGTSPTNLIIPSANLSSALIEAVDLSNLSSSANLATAGSYAGRVIFRNCKLPASWSGSLASGTLLAGERYEMHNCDNADTNYRLLVSDYLGTIRSETTIVRSGGASDGAVSFSWRMASNATAEYPLLPLASPELPARWNSTVGSAITVTVEIITDGVTLNDDECWLEVQYLGAAGFPLSLFASDAKASVLATAANQTTSTETWTTTGLASPTKQKLSVTFTPQEAGYLQGAVKLAKASTTAYVCPKMVVT